MLRYFILGFFVMLNAAFAQAPTCKAESDSLRVADQALQRNERMLDSNQRRLEQSIDAKDRSLSRIDGRVDQTKARMQVLQSDFALSYGQNFFDGVLQILMNQRRNAKRNIIGREAQKTLNKLFSTARQIKTCESQVKSLSKQRARTESSCNNRIERDTLRLKEAEMKVNGAKQVSDKCIQNLNQCIASGT